MNRDGLWQTLTAGVLKEVCVCGVGGERKNVKRVKGRERESAGREVEAGGERMEGGGMGRMG